MGVLSPSSYHASLGVAALLRGGGAPATVVFQDFTSQALGYFNGIRIPASFLAGSTLGAIFVFKSLVKEMQYRNTTERRCIQMYHVSAVLAFLLSVNTIISATVAHISILHGQFDPMADTAYMLMKREFEYEFVSTRWSFFVSLFAFLVAVTMRLLLEFDLLKRDADGKLVGGNTVATVVCSMAALFTHLMSFVNNTLYCWRSIIGMTLHLFKMTVRCAVVERKPLQIMSVLSSIAAVFFVSRASLEGMRANEE